MNNQLQLTTASSYLKAALFIGANIALPHLFHLVPGGGVMFLPIYVFTLCGALCYGWRFGLLTAVMTPLAGYLLFDAPALVMVPDMMLKGAVLSVVAAGWFDGVAFRRCSFRFSGFRYGIARHDADDACWYDCIETEIITLERID